jgi:hypothetical protein
VRSVGETASGAPAASTLLVWNGTGERVTLAWVPVSGDDVAYASVPPYGVVGQQTFEGHAWRIAAAQGGACLGVFVATAGLCRVRLGVEEAGAAMMIQPRRRGRAAEEASSSRPRRRGRASDAAEPH